jgi:hypothetical protein
MFMAGIFRGNPSCVYFPIINYAMAKIMPLMTDSGEMRGGKKMRGFG